MYNTNLRRPLKSDLHAMDNDHEIYCNVHARVASIAVRARHPAQVEVLRHAVQGAQTCDSNLVVVEVLPGKPLDLLSINCVNAQHHLCWWQTTSVCQHLLSQRVAGGLSRGGCRKQLALQLPLCTLNLLVGNAEGEHVGAEHQLTNGVLNSNLITSDIVAENAGVPVELVEGLELVCATDLHLVR